MFDKDVNVITEQYNSQVKSDSVEEDLPIVSSWWNNGVNKNN